MSCSRSRPHRATLLIFTAYTLCDPLTREIVSQHYIAQHPELRL